MVKALKSLNRLRKKSKKLEESIGNSESHNNTEITEKERMVERPKDATNVSEKFKEIIRSNKKNVVWVACQQGIIF